MSRIVTIQAGDVDLNYLGCAVEALGQRPSDSAMRVYAGTLKGYDRGESYTHVKLHIYLGGETIPLSVGQNVEISVMAADEPPESEKPARSAVHFGSPATRTGKA